MKAKNKSLAWAANQFYNRSLQDISYRMNRGFSKPTRIIFCVTLRCNIKCQQCAIWRMPSPEELTTDEWKKVITDMRKWMGPFRVQLAGGETFVRKDIMDIVRHATEQDVLTGIVTNGTLISRELAREITDSGLGYIHVSLDGITAKTHDLVRGLPGIYEKTMSAIEYLDEASRGSGMALCVATVISRKNIHEIIDLVKFVDKKKINGIIFNPIGPTIDSDPDWYKKTDLWFDDLTEVNAVIDQLIEMKKKGSRILNPPEQFQEMKAYFKNPNLQSQKNCMVGMTNLSITCDGFIHTCFKMEPLGNVRDITPQEAWNSPQAMEMRKKIKNCSIHCSPGNFVYRRSLLSEVVRFLKFG